MNREAHLVGGVVGGVGGGPHRSAELPQRPRVLPETIGQLHEQVNELLGLQNRLSSIKTRTIGPGLKEEVKASDAQAGNQAGKLNAVSGSHMAQLDVVVHRLREVIGQLQDEVSTLEDTL